MDVATDTRAQREATERRFAQTLKLEVQMNELDRNMDIQFKRFDNIKR